MPDTRAKPRRGARLMGPSRDEYAAAARAETAARVELALERLTTDDGWHAYLAACARLHYSWRNCALIEYQCAGASYLAGFSRWATEGFTVREGETAIRVTALVPGKGFRELPLFDVSQCDGDRETLDFAAAERAETIADALAARLTRPPAGASRQEITALAKIADREAKNAAAAAQDIEHERVAA
jgi:hypothetical protein